MKVKFKALSIILYSALLTLPCVAELNSAATEYYTLGLSWQRKGDEGQAEQAFRKAVSLSPKDADLRTVLAALYLKRGQTDAAITEYTNSIQINPSSAKNRILLGQALSRANRLPEAIEQFKTATELEPNYPYIFLNLGQAQQLAGQNEEAIISLQKVLAEDPNSSKALSSIATAYHKTNRLNEAISYYQKILSSETGNEWARLNLARAYNQAGNTVQAEQEYLTLLQSRPRGTDILAALADIQYKKGNLKDAISYANKALSVDSNDVTLHAMLAAYYDQAKDFNQSLTHYRVAAQLETNPENRNKYLLAESQILFKSGSYNEAASLTEEVLRKNPDSLPLKVQLADIRLWQKRYGESAALYREALVLKPDFAKNKEVLFNYGAALSGMKDWANAEVVWMNYLNLETRNKEAWLNAAMVQSAQKKYGEAVNSYKKALALGASKQQILSDIASLQIQAGDLSGAEQTYRDLIVLNPSVSKYKIALSRILSRQGKADEAIKLLRDAGQSSTSLQLELADKIAKSGDYYAATTEYQKVLNEEPNNPDAILGLADAYSSISQFKQALELYKKYLSSNPDNFHVQYNYASALANVGRENEAVTEYKRAIEMNPGYAESYYSLGAVLLNKDINLARSNWRKYLELQPQGEYKSEILHHFPDLK